MMVEIFKDKKWLLTGVLAALTFGFLGLSYFVVINPPSAIDLHISEELQERHSELLDGTMKVVSWFGTMPHSLIMVIFTALIFYTFEYKREAGFTLLTLLSGVISSGLKLLINRPRPTEDLVRIVEHAKHQSFPSGHTLFYTIFFGFLIVMMSYLNSIPRLLRLVVISLSALMVFLVPMSRVYLGAHWFTDVLGGFILGILCLSLLGYLYLFPSKKSTKQ
ncbi:MAG: phosphatase PAP2 family protein [Pedobacter sp.]|nr:MAG: phosphatase PAP2 family protein [Pedobacter sp.]